VSAIKRRLFYDHFDASEDAYLEDYSIVLCPFEMHDCTPRFLSLVKAIMRDEHVYFENLNDNKIIIRSLIVFSKSKISDVLPPEMCAYFKVYDDQPNQV
jgi:hypothetical protein